MEVKGYEVKEVGPGIWMIVSSVGKLYYVWKNEKYVCTCPYYNIYHRECKHIKIVKECSTGQQIEGK